MTLLANTPTAVAVTAWATSLGAVGTVGAFITGGILLFRQIQRDGKSDERQQALDERLQDRDDAADAARDREQAERIAAWVDQEGKVRVANHSLLPVYGFTVVWVDGSGNELKTAGAAAIGPEETYIFSGVGEEGALIETRFRDATGQLWERDRLGQLQVAT